MRTYQELLPKFKVPFTTTEPDKIPSFPVIAKPRCGKGSRDVILIEDESDLRYVASKYDEMIFQRYLPGIEYTIDVLSDLNKEPLFAVPRIRLQTKGGISTKGKISRNQKMEEDCMSIAKSLGIRGPCCIQMKETEDSEPKLVEVNARLGGGTIFTTLAGANIPALILDLVEGKEISVPKISEVTVIRYFEEICCTLSIRSPNNSHANNAYWTIIAKPRPCWFASCPSTVLLLVARMHAFASILK